MSYSITNKIKFFSVSIVQWICFLKEIKKIISDVKKMMDVFNAVYLKDAQLVSICNDPHAKTQTPIIYKRFWEISDILR